MSDEHTTSEPDVALIEESDVIDYLRSHESDALGGACASYLERVNWMGSTEPYGA